MQRHREAIESVERAREIEPLSPPVNLYLGVAQTHAGQYDLAQRQIQGSIELDPSHYRSYMFLGRNLNFLERYEDAIVAFQKALDLNPTNLEALAFKAEAHAYLGERQKALDIVMELKAAEVRTEPAILIAGIYARLGLDTEFFETLEKAVAKKSAPIYIAILTENSNPFTTDPRYHRFLDSIGLSHLAR
jgi:tetratricopeptide (TPR) repeat protein